MSCKVCLREMPIAARGLCRACYSRWNKRGTTDYAPVRKRGVCSVKGCDRPHAARGFCDLHHQRVLETGDPLETKRPDDWGAKTKHPLYNAWARLMRYRGHSPVAEEWNDFLQFAADVGERPPESRMLFRADESRPYGPDNYVWKRSITQRVEGEDEATYKNRRARAYRHVYQERYPQYDLKKHYGLSKDEYEGLHEKQCGKCALCGQAETGKRLGKAMFRLAVEHCHGSGKIRQLLCRSCNMGLGAFRDDPELLKRAIKYLRRHASAK